MVRLKRTQLGTMNTEAAASERLIQHLDGKKEKKVYGNRTERIRHLCWKTAVFSCRRCIKTLA